MPNLYEDETRPERLSPAHRVQRLQRRRRRFAIVTTLTVVLLVALAARAWAWTANASGYCDCDGTTFTVNVGNEPGTHTAALTFDGETKTQTVPAEGGNTITFHFASHDGGDWSYRGTWSDSPGEVETNSGTLPAVVDCEQEEPTPTTAPPTPTTAPTVEEPEEPKDDEPQGSSTNQTRSEPNPDDSIGAPTPTIEEAPVPATPGTLPFTGPREDMQRAMLLSGLALVLAGVALLVTMRRRPAVAVEQGWGETRVRPDRDSADANLLATLFGRRSR